MNSENQAVPNQKSFQVFVSHSSKDRLFVQDEIIPFLEAAGFGVWYCGDEIVAAEVWEREIYDGLTRSDFFMIVLSPDAVDSLWVRTELSWALDHRWEKIIPVVHRSCNTDELNLQLRNIQHVDFSDDSPEARARLMIGLEQLRDPEAARQAANLPRMLEQMGREAKGSKSISQTDPQSTPAPKPLPRRQPSPKSLAAPSKPGIGNWLVSPASFVDTTCHFHSVWIAEQDNPIVVPEDADSIVGFFAYYRLPLFRGEAWIDGQETQPFRLTNYRLVFAGLPDGRPKAIFPLESIETYQAGRLLNSKVAIVTRFGSFEVALPKKSAPKADLVEQMRQAEAWTSLPIPVQEALKGKLDDPWFG